MKKPYSILLFFLLTLNSFSQINLPFPDSTGAWIQTWGGMNGSAAFRLYVNGDTLINAKPYKVLSIGNTDLSDSSVYYAGSNILGFYRLDSNKVYYLDNPLMTFSIPFFFSDYNNSYFGDTAEVLLYDFNIQIGDTVLLSSNYFQETVLASIDSIQLNGNYYTRWNFDYYNPPSGGVYSWIEGIGSTIGFFPYYYFFEDGVTFHCFHENSEDIIFYLGSASSCQTVGVNEGDHENNRVSIFPNPASEQIIIQIKGFRLETNVVLTDVTGKVISQENILSGNFIRFSVADLESGIYFVTISNQLFSKTEKIIVQK